jgi:hypothetical protein
VIHAFHITGMEFDIITGSSIGAMNSVFFAEYLYRKHLLPEDVRADPLQSMEAMDLLVKAYHHAWLLMPEKRVIDDHPQGPLGKIQDDLLRFNVSLPQLTRLAWWWTDPEPKQNPGAEGVVGAEPAERAGRTPGRRGQVLRILKEHGRRQCRRRYAPT